MKTMMVDDHGNALDSFDSLREGISALRRICAIEPEAKEEIALLVFDEAGMPIDTILYEDVSVEDS